MFTGLVQDVGVVSALAPAGGGVRLAIRPSRLPAAERAHGEAGAVDGGCRTVVEAGAAGFSAEVSPETLARTALGAYRPGTRVNLERAVRLADRLGGHLVLGHVDGVGTLVSREDRGAYGALSFEAPAPVAPWLLEKGSIAVDGISLTVNALEDLPGGGARFEVMIVPTTQAETALGDKQRGAQVNLEGDVIGKYVARLLARGQRPALDEDLLRRSGFA